MIYDRTQIDVDNAISIRNKKIKLDETGKPADLEQLTESEINYLERGTLNANTLNRIEEKQAELSELFNELGYWNTNITNKTWAIGDDFYADEFDRVLNNEKTLINAFFVRSDTPSLPTSFLGYQDTNSVEKILHDLDVMINDVKSNYRECGNFECGSD